MRAGHVNTLKEQASVHGSIFFFIYLRLNQSILRFCMKKKNELALWDFSNVSQTVKCVNDESLFLHRWLHDLSAAVGSTRLFVQGFCNDNVRNNRNVILCVHYDPCKREALS